MPSSREKCPGCDKKALRYRSRTDDFRCKECGKIFASRRFEVEDALLLTVSELAKILRSIENHYGAPERYYHKREPGIGQGCLIVLIWGGLTCGAMFLPIWEWYWRLALGIGGGFVGALLISVGLDTLFEPALMPAKSGDSTRELAAYGEWQKANPVLAKYHEGPFRAILENFADDPGDLAQHNRDFYAISDDGMSLRLYEHDVGREVGLTMAVDDSDVEAVMKVAQIHLKADDVSRLDRALKRLVPAIQTQSTDTLRADKDAADSDV